MYKQPARHPVWEFLIPPSDYGKPERTALHAEGTRITFADGRMALCATSGLWNVNLGYGNAAVTEAISDALRRSSYLSLFRGGHQHANDAARALLRACGPEWFGRVLFSTSGSAANDLVMKLVRQHALLCGEPARTVIVGLKGSYHGQTYGSFALTGESLGQPSYGVDQRLVRHVRHDDADELDKLLAREGDRIAAVVLEPVLGTGAHLISPEMLDRIGPMRERHGFLLVADEVATGFGRTGTFFASERWPTRPDVLVTSKGLTNGTCGAAAVVVSHEVCERFERADATLMHGETQAGTPSTCAAIMATLAEMERIGACDRAREISALLDDALADLSGHPLVTGHCGTGCFRALQLARDGMPLAPTSMRRVLESIRAAGAVVHPAPSAIQLVPALVYTDDEVVELRERVRAGLDAAAEELP